MAPYDRSGDSLPLIITDHAIGVHSIHQQDGVQEFEVKLLTTTKEKETKPSPKRWTFKKIEKKKSKKQKKDSSNKKSKSKKQRRCIHFNEDIGVLEIPHKSEITPEEKARLWVNYHDWHATQNERQRVSRAVVFGNLTVETQSEELLLRGMETLMPDFAARRREAIHVAKTLVLREQARAKLDQQPMDVERLAWWYASATKESKNAAIEQAVDDYFQVIQDLGGGKSLSDIV